MEINLKINNKAFTVPVKDLPADITLNTFIREHAQLTGTKFMCLEGGCGACIVTVRRRHPVSKEYYVFAVNSCLVLLNVCNYWEITTIEGLGDKNVGYHPLQQRLASMNGSQCGYCSPAFIMNMYGLISSSKTLAMEEIENSFGGNICRCTGYRPILDAMKSFARNSDFEYIDSANCSPIIDIEELISGKCSDINISCKWEEQCSSKNGRELCVKKSSALIAVDGRKWYYPRTLKEIFVIFDMNVEGKEYMLVAGSTGHGVYRRREDIEIFINLNEVEVLHRFSILPEQGMIEIGASCTLTEIMDIFRTASTVEGFEYCSELRNHIDKVANVPVRNVGTIAGNLMLKHDHHHFASDIFLILCAVEATVTIAVSEQTFHTITVPEFYNYNMRNCVITTITLRKWPKDEILFNSYKIMPRAQNAHAFVHAAFLVKFLPDDDEKIEFANLCFGAINDEFIHASATQQYLVENDFFDSRVAENSISILSKELTPDWELPDPSPEYRVKVACGLLYKFFLHNYPSYRVEEKFISGGSIIKRALSSGTQTFETNEKIWPINQPIIKIEAQVQCSGEAEYINDIPRLPQQVWAAFVQAEVVSARVYSMDPSEALQIPGVVAFFSAKDIPGTNSFVSVGRLGILSNEKVFCDGVVEYFSQPVGVIVAETFQLALYASKKVKISYNSLEKTERKKFPPSFKEALKDKRISMEECDCLSKLPITNSEERKNELQQSMTEVNGRFEVNGQYHFCMETQTCVCIPNEDGITVYSATHYVDNVHAAISDALKIHQSKVDIIVRRLGGSYGFKLTRSGHVAVACSLASIKLNRPVRFVQSLESGMETVGKRASSSVDYSSTVDKNSGKIITAHIHFYEDVGNSLNDDPVFLLAMPAIPNCYNPNVFTKIGLPILTNAPSSTWCRAPGTLEAIAMTENLIEHIAHVVKRDPVDVRLENMEPNAKIKELLTNFISSTEYRSRKSMIDQLNDNNRWRKRGIAISIMRFPIVHWGPFSATVSVYHADGTVAISHGGIEMGQGLNTKVAQVAARLFNIPVSQISIKPTNTLTGANQFCTGASIASESVCNAVQKCCVTLLKRLNPYRSQLGGDISIWIDIIRKAFFNNVNLTTTERHEIDDLKSYDVWGLACSEIEVDILTGNFVLNRVDIFGDTGESLSPLIDVGQIEGAFIMGIGYWLTEKLVYDQKTGKLITNRTWNYKVPGAKDIPVDFRITLLQNNPNSGGFMRSKTTGEISICMSISALFALRHALNSARKDANLPDDWYTLGAPTTIEEIVLAAGHDISQFTME